MTTRRQQLAVVLACNGESFADIEASTISDSEMGTVFNKGQGGTEGRIFTVWTAKTVYFLICYGGVEWMGYVPRHPDAAADSQGRG